MTKTKVRGAIQELASTATEMYIRPVRIYDNAVIPGGYDWGVGATWKIEGATLDISAERGSIPEACEAILLLKAEADRQIEGDRG